MKRQKLREKSLFRSGHFWNKIRTGSNLRKRANFAGFGAEKVGSEQRNNIYSTIVLITVEQVRNWLLIVLDAADTITNQTRARHVRGCVWQLNHLLGRATIDQGFWERCGEVLTQVSGWLIVGRQYPAGVAKGYRYLLDRCIADIPALPPDAQAAARLGVEIGELLYLELTSDTNQEDLCHH